MARYIILSIIVAIAGGCQPQFDLGTKEDFKQQVLDNDPAFNALLDKKAKVDEEIAILEVEFKEKSRQLNSRIDELKQELSVARREANIRIKSIDSQLEPYREEIKNRTKELVAEIKLKESSLSDVNKTASRLNKMIQQGESFGDIAKETPKWQDKIVALKEQAEELQRDIVALRGKIRINRVKLKLLR